MEKLSLLEKLKTLNQWQLQQQLHFAKLQADVENGHRNDEDSDKENNLPWTDNETHQQQATTSAPFMQTMSRNALTNALRSIDLNSPKRLSIDSRTTSEGDEDTSLPNWHFSGLQTVKFMSNTEDEANIQKATQGFSDTEEDFSDGEILNFDSEDGVRPFSETEDEENGEGSASIWQNNNNNGQTSEWNQNYMVERTSNLVDHRDNNGRYFSGNLSAEEESGEEQDEEESDHECTVLHQSLSDAQDNHQGNVNIDEKPVKSRLKDSGLTFDGIVEEEMKNHMESELNTSTPMKKKKHKFLRRGEGIKRFEKGNLVAAPQKENAVKKRQDQPPAKSKGMAFSIKPPTPPSQDANERTAQSRNKTKPGLPLKLKLNRLKPKAASIPTSQAPKNQVPQMSLVVEDDSHEKQKQPFVQPEENSGDAIDSKYFNPPEKPTSQESISSSVLEASFQKMLLHYEEKEEIENKELDDFEALEEAAENMSLSSNSSLVVKLLGIKKQKKPDENNNKHKLQQLDEEKLLSPKNDNSGHDERQRIPSYDFEDESSWSDHSHNDTSLFSASAAEDNDDTIIRETSPQAPDSPDQQEETEESLPPPKRIISKKKDGNDSLNKFKQDEMNGYFSADLYGHPTISMTFRKKLVELESEIKTFRSENEKLEKLRYERESEVSKLRREIQAFQQERKSETERFETYKTEEMSKLKGAKKVFDKYQKAARDFPNKQEREEVIALKQELQSLEEDLTTRESRWTNASRRFRTRVTELEEENTALRCEIKLFEEERLERWKKSNHQEVTSKESHGTKRMLIESKQDEVYTIKSEVIEDEEPCAKKKSLSPRSPPSAPIVRDQLVWSSPVGESVPVAPEEHLGLTHHDGKKEILLPDKSKLITFPNGTRKTVSPDGRIVSICFFNGDVKRILPDNRIVYYYAESKTTHTTFTDGIEVLEFANKQIEKRYTDGHTEVLFPDQTVKHIYPDGIEETVFKDGTIQKLETNGSRTILFPNGQKETHTKQFKRREYPNGTVKTVYEDGRQETNYSNGRIRIKDKHGNLILDRK